MSTIIDSYLLQAELALAAYADFDNNIIDIPELKRVGLAYQRGQRHLDF